MMIRFVDWWVKNYADVGKKENYSEAGIAEYINYINAIDAITKEDKK